MKKNISIILASNSPRRRELFEFIQIPFQAASPRYVEVSQKNWSGEVETLNFAREKAKSLEQDFPKALIIGSDTLVEWNGKKLGKPQDAEHALEMLMMLSGKVHRVLTAIAILDSTSGTLQEHLESTSVKMKSFSKSQAQNYVASGEPMGKAGAYAIQGQGGELVEWIDGDYFNVVGLPLKALVNNLQKFGIQVEQDMEKVYASSGFQKVKCSK